MSTIPFHCGGPPPLVTLNNSPRQGDKQNTLWIVPPPTRVTFQVGTTTCCIFAKQPVLMDLLPKRFNRSFSRQNVVYLMILLQDSKMDDAETRPYLNCTT